jgi:NAD(P)-dependent dehydrogenase (short-subunit alcohol dehydrogenase family)
MEIKGKRVLITGASRGLGQELVFAFANAGAAQVVAGIRKAEDGERLISKAAGIGAQIAPIKLDVTVDEDVAAAAQHGPFDILVNNAGICSFGNPLTMSFENIQKEVEINYLGVLRVTRAIAPEMAQRRSGTIVNVGSILGKINLPMAGTYCATKAALLSLGQALRAFLNEKGIQVITVMPSGIDTDMTRGADVPKLSREFVAAEILRAITEGAYDPAIGEEAIGVIEGLKNDPLSMEKMFAQYK